MNEPQPSPDMLVYRKTLHDAHAVVTTMGTDAALDQLLLREPVLVHFLLSQWKEVFQEVRPTADPKRIARSREQMRRAVAVAFTALMSAHYELWRGTAVGTRLEQIDPALRRSGR